VIVVAGEALVDLILRPDGAIAAVPGGGPYNAARAIGRLGVPVAWIGGLSSDRFGRELEAGLIADGVSLDLVQRTELPTTLALAELDDSGAATYRFYTEGTAAPEVVPGPLAGGLPAGTRAVHAGTLGFVLEPMATTLAALVDALPDDVLLLADPNCRPSIIRDAAAFRARMTRVLARADVVKVSTEDLAFLRPREPVDDALAWLAGFGAAAILLTDGGAPVRVVAGDETHAIEVPPVAVVDTVGAGDTFGGAVLACLVHDGVRRGALDAAAAIRAARFGVRAAAIACTRAGAAPPTLGELGGWPA
jgi:fructokinase